jgi:hypothetical protein
MREVMFIFKQMRTLLICLSFILTIFNSLYAEDHQYTIEKIKIDFSNPWSSAFLPNGDILVNELSGKIKLIKSETKNIIEI